MFLRSLKVCSTNLLHQCFRFIKHTSKPQEKSVPVEPVEKEESKTTETKADATPKPRGTAPIASDDKLKAATPGMLLSMALTCQTNMIMLILVDTVKSKSLFTSPAVTPQAGA